MSIFSLLPILAQESENPGYASSSSTKNRTYIPDTLATPVFTPPAPAEPKRLPNIRIDASNTVASESGKTLTLQRGAASTLPDLPPPPP
ncbi:MAG: hypothetical protein ABIT37_08665, partial [Luteolibacter sp.]